MIMMKHDKFELSESLARMQEVFESKGDEYRRYPYIPQEGIMEGDRGYFVDCVVIVSRLFFRTNQVSLLGLAKVYDIYIHEAKRILTEHELCHTVIVHGNSIIGVFNVGPEGYLNGLMDVAGRMSSLPDVINVKAGRKQKPLIGNICGMEVGHLYAVKEDDNIDFFGGMLNRAEQWIAKRDEEDERRGIYISQKVRDGLKEQYQQFFKIADFDDLYYGMVENVGMAKWVKEQ